MIKNEIKLVCTDIDGTLINDRDQLPANFDEVIKALKERGIIFVAASGRGLESIVSKLDNKSDNIYYISDNGALLEHDGDVFFQNNFSKEDVIKIAKIFRKSTEMSLIATSPDKSYVELHPDHKEEFIGEYFPTYEIVEDVTKVDDDFIKITMRSDYNSDANLMMPEIQALNGDFHLVRAGVPWIDIMKAESNKGNALEQLLKHLDIKVEETIGFGDFPNDIHMLEVVGTAYAMENAHPEVKEVADEIIGSNNENSVLNKVIELLDL